MVRYFNFRTSGFKISDTSEQSRDLCETIVPKCPHPLKNIKQGLEAVVNFHACIRITSPTDDAGIRTSWVGGANLQFHCQILLH